MYVQNVNNLAIHEYEKVRVSREFSEHVELAQQEREYYISSAKNLNLSFPLLKKLNHHLILHIYIRFC